MYWNDIVYATGDLLRASFKALPMIGNSFNYLMIVVGFILIFGWMRRMAQYDKEAEQNGTIK